MRGFGCVAQGRPRNVRTSLPDYPSTIKSTPSARLARARGATENRNTRPAAAKSRGPSRAALPFLHGSYRHPMGIHRYIALPRTDVSVRLCEFMFTLDLPQCKSCHMTAGPRGPGRPAPMLLGRGANTHAQACHAAWMTHFLGGRLKPPAAPTRGAGLFSPNFGKIAFFRRRRGARAFQIFGTLCF